MRNPRPAAMIAAMERGRKGRNTMKKYAVKTSVRHFPKKTASRRSLFSSAGKSRSVPVVDRNHEPLKKRRFTVNRLE